MTNPGPRIPPPWLAQAQALKAAGHSQRSICQAVKAGHESVKFWLAKYPPGTKPPLEPPIQESPVWEAKARKLRIDGLSWEAVGQALGIGSYKIRKVLDPQFVDRRRQEAKFRIRPDRKRRDDWEARLIEKRDKPKMAVGKLAAGRFYRVEDVRHGR
jgi:hypothetical protein